MKLPIQVFASLLSAVALTAIGCGGGASPTDSAEHSHDGHSHAGHTHDAWWCDEHGVPEDVCGLCSAKLAADFQKKGDWCKKHDRPDSQCFVCHPELEAKFAALYEAKYGKKPPKPTDDGREPSESL